MGLNKRKCKNETCGREFQKQRPLDMYCSPACERERSARLREQKKQKDGFKPNFKGISNISQKRMGELSIYRPIRDKYLEAHPVCEVDDCDNRTTNLHHKMGRVGYADQEARDKGLKLLWDTRYFMACCNICHPHRIHNNPEWAEQLGYIVKKSAL